MTTAEPFGALVGEARRLEREGLPGHAAKILAATLIVGCAWTDSPDTGMAAVVTADGSPETARAAAQHLARRVWDARKQFHYGCETADLEAGITRALNAKEPTVFLTDSGDNVTASAPGDLPIVLRYLVEHKIAGAVVAGIFDQAATRQCFAAGQGGRVRLAIGATVETRHGPALAAEVEVVRLVKSEPRMAVVSHGRRRGRLAGGPAGVHPARAVPRVRHRPLGSQACGCQGRLSLPQAGGDCPAAHHAADAGRGRYADREVALRPSAKTDVSLGSGYKVRAGAGLIRVRPSAPRSTTASVAVLQRPLE